MAYSRLDMGHPLVHKMRSTYQHTAVLPLVVVVLALTYTAVSGGQLRTVGVLGTLSCGRSAQAGANVTMWDTNLISKSSYRHRPAH